LWQNGGAKAQQREALFVNSGTRANKYFVQFSIWNKGAKNLNSIYDSLEKYLQKKNIKKFCENGASLKKSCHFSMKKLELKIVCKKKFSIKREIRM